MRRYVLLGYAFGLGYLAGSNWRSWLPLWPNLGAATS